MRVVFGFCEKKEGYFSKPEIMFQKWTIGQGIVIRSGELSWMKLNYLEDFKNVFG